MQMKWEGSVHPDSILGQIVTDELKKAPGFISLPASLRDALLKEAVYAMHEEFDPFGMDDVQLEQKGKKERGPHLEAIIPKWGRKSYFIVRDEDLGLFDAICSGLQAAAGAGFFLLGTSLSSSTIPAMTAIVVSTFRVLRRFTRRA